MEVAWTTREYSVRQRTPVCGRVNKGVEQDVGNRDKTVNSIPPTNRWANRKNKPRIITISLVLHGTQIERLAGMVGVS